MTANRQFATSVQRLCQCLMFVSGMSVTTNLAFPGVPTVPVFLVQRVLESAEPVTRVHHQVGSLSSRLFSSEPAQAKDGVTTPGDLHQRQVDVVETYLRHIYSIYLGLKSCSELRAQLNDSSFISGVSVEEARKTLHAIDAVSSSIGIDVSSQWAQAVPKAVVTAEALKRDPASSVALCQRLGSLFRTDEANLQNLFGMLGSRQVLMPKDF